MHLTNHKKPIRFNLFLVFNNKIYINIYLCVYRCSLPPNPGTQQNNPTPPPRPNSNCTQVKIIRERLCEIQFRDYTSHDVTMAFRESRAFTLFYI